VIPRVELTTAECLKDSTIRPAIDTPPQWKPKKIGDSYEAGLAAIKRAMLSEGRK
jgi:hypothetical protein